MIAEAVQIKRTVSEELLSQREASESSNIYRGVQHRLQRT